MQNMEMVRDENFIRNQTFEEKLIFSTNAWVDPFDSVWLKLVTIVVYIIEVSESVIMMAFVVYETNGYNGHYRTLINQLLSHLYGGVGYILLILKH